MEYNVDWIRKLYFNILQGTFDWKKYQDRKTYYGVEIQAMALYDTSSSSGCDMYGFIIVFPFQEKPNIYYNWKRGIFQVGKKKISFDAFTKEIRYD